MNWLCTSKGQKEGKLTLSIYYVPDCDILYTLFC